ncbi:unnamed protein product [Clonostachys solani]|uniref:Uncharacterized protein n=1 Tax=Clonostachys solani TaxID=160281 RepID=A0A9N9VU77_9HYPO|nr:unnamed protein product [Clonostachys solani]
MVYIKQLTLTAALVLSAAQSVLAAPAAYNSLARRDETDAEAAPGAKGAKHNSKKDYNGSVVGKTKPVATIMGGVVGRDLEEHEETGYIEFVERSQSEDLAERDFYIDALYERYLDSEDLAERDFDIDALYERYLGADDLVERDFESADLAERDFEVKDLYDYLKAKVTIIEFILIH